MNSIGIMGGTFDPIHNGHLITATYIKETLNFDKILFIPCYISPLKTNIISSDSKHRLEMLKIAIRDIPYFDISDIELNSPDISYTYTTLLKLREFNTSLNLIIGYDNYAIFDKWYNPEGIFNLAKIFVLKRNLKSKDIIINHSYKEKFVFLDNPFIEISSTEIRNRIKLRQSIKYFVPEEVENYILKNNLYR